MTHAAETSRSARVIPTTGIHNFRDYGATLSLAEVTSYAAPSIVSGEHTHATDRDLTLVNRLGLSAIFDLRGTAERQKAPCRRPEGSPHRSICRRRDNAGRGTAFDAAVNAFDTDTARRQHVRTLCKRSVSTSAC